MIVQHAVEAAVNAVVDVVKVRHGIVVVVRQLTAPENARRQCERRRHVIAPRFGDDVNAAAVGEVFIQRAVDDRGDFADGRAAVARIAAAQIKQRHVVAVRGSQIEKLTTCSNSNSFLIIKIINLMQPASEFFTDFDSSVEDFRLVASGTDMEADSDQVDVKLTCQTDEARRVFG